MRPMAMVYEPIVRHQLQVIREEFGGIDSYLDRIGFDREDRLRLRSVLVDGE